MTTRPPEPAPRRRRGTRAARRASSKAGRLEQRLLEACDDLWNAWVDPRDAYCDADGTPWLELGAADLVGGPLRGAFSTEAEHRQIRAACRQLALTNEFAINGHENRVSYIVGQGHTYQALPHKHALHAEALAAAVQEVIDEFVDENAWHARQQEIVRRRDRDGEVFLRLFADVDGPLRVRFIEPGLVATPSEAAGDPAASFGIATEPDDVETVRGYWVEAQWVPAEEVQHRKANVDLNVKRGLPLYYPVLGNLRRAEKLLRNMSVVCEIQSAIALIRRHRRGTRSGIERFVSQRSDAGTAAAGPRPGRHLRYAPGTILDAPADIEYEFPAARIDAGSYVHVLQAELRAIAARLVMPEFMFTSDASNANYASTMVAEGPAVKMFQRLQAEQVADDLAVLWRAVEHAIRQGRLPAEAFESIQIEAAPPSVAVRDELREAQVARIEFAHGLLSPQTWSRRRGLDYEQEQANLAAHRAGVGT